ncbi:hemolysin III [Burkholderiaceae bacterium 16]|uniref:PAQR family membrane homeostasis protein TrhA n=1 Tax=Cupriavidus basilensis TaxID=68895 RepID=UPI0005EBAF31|nr:hemolysin III family protein [Cupriavidus basilensis]KJK25304.1 hemolysin III [Burkholderiaceae bacterium 16]MDF3887423.1 hemolysin III family protein [Cupriavidus basilensis]
MYRGERFNGYSHLAGAILAAAGTAVLITTSALYHDAWKVVSSVVYGTTLVFLYTISTLYHSLRGRPKDILRRLDYCAIYLLIAGSYTPFALVTLRGPWGWTLFGVNWGLAVIGIAQELWIGHRTRVFSLLIYVLMGWLVLFAFGPLVAALPAAGLYWLVAGGVLYTAGIVFFLFDEKVRHFHGIWHLFVLAGSACQFVSILWYVG